MKQPVRKAEVNITSTASAKPRTSSRIVAIAGLSLLFLFFSPFVSCAGDTFSGAEAFQESLSMQVDMTAEGGYASGISLILFPIAGIVALLAGLQALRDSSRGRSIRRQGDFALLAALATGWPIFEAIRVVIRSEGMWQLEWGFYSSVLAVAGVLIGAHLMRKDSSNEHT